MDIQAILSQIDDEISRLTQAKALLMTGSESSEKRSVGRPKKTAGQISNTKTLVKRRPLSPEGKARIAAAQKKRWAAKRRADKAEAAS